MVDLLRSNSKSSGSDSDKVSPDSIADFVVRKERRRTKPPLAASHDKEKKIETTRCLAPDFTATGRVGSDHKEGHKRNKWNEA